MGIGIAALIVAVFFVISVLTICFEAAFKNENEKNLNEGIKKGKEEQQAETINSFPPPELERPKEK